MPNFREMMVKLAAQGKGAKVAPKTRVEQLRDEASTAPVQGPVSEERASPQGKTSPQTRVTPQVTSSPTSPPEHRNKRQQADDEEAAGFKGCSLGDKYVSGGTFILPPCFAQRNLFEGEGSLSVPAKDKAAIMDSDRQTRRESLSRDAAGMLRVLKVALALNDAEACSQKDYNAAKARIAELEQDNMDLHNDKLLLEGQLESRTELMREVTETRAEMETMSEENKSLKKKVADLEAERKVAASKHKHMDNMSAENERLKTRVAELEAVIAPAEEENEDEMRLKTRAELIARIRSLGADCIAAVNFGFDAAVEQLQVVNPELQLVTDGIGPLHQIVDGQVVPPEFE